MNCYLCLKEADKNWSLLKCGHYCCPVCYCNQKSNKIDKCQICNKKLIRGLRRIK